MLERKSPLTEPSRRRNRRKLAFVPLQGPPVSARNARGFGGVGGTFLNLSSCPVSSVVSFLVAFGNDLLELQNLFFF